MQHVVAKNLGTQHKFFFHVFVAETWPVQKKILVFSIQYDFQVLKYQYQYSIWKILNKYQYQYAKKTEVSVFSISILSGKKHEKASKPSRFEKLRWTIFTKQERPPFLCHYLQPKERLIYCLNLMNQFSWLLVN